MVQEGQSNKLSNVLANPVNTSDKSMVCSPVLNELIGLKGGNFSPGYVTEPAAVARLAKMLVD